MAIRIRRTYLTTPRSDKLLRQPALDTPAAAIAAVEAELYRWLHQSGDIPILGQILSPDLN